ncbi:MAG: ATP-binding cassette domain-containing protein [Kiloniellales bacterium]
MSLSLETLGAGYGGIPVVQEVSLALAPGEILGMVGRNGVGKTTLVKAVAGLLPQVSGCVRLAGEEVTACAAHERALRGMGYVPQGRGIFPKLTVLENLRMGERIGGGHDPRHYDQVLEWFPRLRERLRQVAGTLSGGEQQMLSIGRVLIGKPSLLVLEPDGFSWKHSLS